MSDSRIRLSNRLGALVLALCDRLRVTTEAAAGQSAAAPAALVALHQFLAGGTIDALRRVVALTPSGAVRLVDRLAEAGLVERHAGRDGRSRAVTLTTQGRTAARRILAARQDALSGLLDVLTDEERAALARIVDKLLAATTSDRLAARASGIEILGGWLCRLCDFGACGRDTGECPVATTAQGVEAVGAG